MANVFADAVVPSRCHFTTIRWQHDGIVRTSRSRFAFLRQSGCFLLPSYIVVRYKNTRWHRRSDEVKTKMTRLDKMPSRREKLTHEFNMEKTLARSSGIYGACQRFRPRSRGCCKSLKKNPPVDKRWLKMLSRKAQCLFDQSWIWTFLLSSVHRVTTSGQCDAGTNSSVFFWSCVCGWACVCENVGVFLCERVLLSLSKNISQIHFLLYIS